MPLRRRRWMFPNYMRKLHNLSFPFDKHIVGKLDSWVLWRYIQFQDKTWGFWEISKNATIVLRNLRPTQQSCRRNMHIHEWTPRRTAGYSPPRRGPVPKLLWADLLLLATNLCRKQYSMLSSPNLRFSDAISTNVSGLITTKFGTHKLCHIIPLSNAIAV